MHTNSFASTLTKNNRWNQYKLVEDNKQWTYVENMVSKPNAPEESPPHE